MGGNYQKSIYDQLMDVMARVDSLEEQHSKDKKEISSITCEIKSLRKSNAALIDEVISLKEENKVLKAECERLDNENRLLRNDNERMKRILNNDSSNSSNPPSGYNTGEKTKRTRSANTYNGRTRSKNKKGAQKGHAGSGLSKEDVKKKINEGVFRHEIKIIGNAASGYDYVTRYKLDFDITAIATEYRIYADENGKYDIPEELKGNVIYGDRIKGIIAYLYSEGVVSVDRISDFINSISGDHLKVSAGTVYNTCRNFSNLCRESGTAIENDLLCAHEICTDSTVISTDGKQSYIRNFSTERSVLYVSSFKKDLSTLGGFTIFKAYTGIFMHDHETAIYHFGTGHGECNVHILRYLLKNTEETGNRWSHDLSMYLKEMNRARKKLIEDGLQSFEEEKLDRYDRRYDEIIARGYEENKSTRGRLAKKEEKTLLGRLVKYKRNHLLFLYDFEVHFSNNMSEKDLRICKNRQKMAGGFRAEAGRDMYCHIMSFIETIKRRSINVFQGIMDLMAGKPVIQQPALFSWNDTGSSRKT